MHILTYSSKQYALLGRLVATKKPEVAKELFLALDGAGQPLATDHTLISAYYCRFCQIQGICPEDYRGPLHKSEKVEIRRLFIAAMLRIYHPQARVLPGKMIYGFVKSLAMELQQRPQNTGKLIREIITMEEVYDDFRQRVSEITSQLTEAA